jgi:5-methylcytosine-specific restriction endonuclease McrA
MVVAYEAFELDHIQPLCEGGGIGDDNAQVLCRECHSAKSSREKSDRGKAVQITRGGMRHI